MSRVGSVEDKAPLCLHVLSPAVVGRRGVGADARMTVLAVVPPEETLTVAMSVLEGAKAGGEAGPVLEGAEM